MLSPGHNRQGKDDLTAAVAACPGPALHKTRLSTANHGMGRGSWEPFLSQLNCWLGIDSGPGRVTVSSCVPNSESTRLQQVAPNAW